MRTRSVRPGIAAAAVAAGLALSPAGPARASDNVPGRPYENRIVGFRFRPLNDWAAVPPGTDPDDPKICGYYSDKAKYDRTLKPECDVFAFKIAKSEGVATEPTDLDGGDGGDEPPKPPTAEELRQMYLAQGRLKSTREVVGRTRERYAEGAEELLGRLEEKKQKKLRAALKAGEPVEKEIKTDDGVLTTIEVNIGIPLNTGDVMPGKIFAGFIRNDEYEVGVVYTIPGANGWKDYAGGVQSSVRTLEFLGGADVAAARKDLEDALVGKTGDERWLEEIKRKVGPGWDYLQTRNYLLVYDKVVKPDRVRLVAVQIEAIRKDVYEVLFPPDRPITAISVVRVCKDKDQYTQYGGPGGSAGYWNPGEQELVFYEDTSAKKDSLRVLNHEAFHQYIFYSVGSISPHDWFNEGHGDYFSGHDYNGSGRFVPKPFSWRRDTIKGAMGSKTYVPLKTFVKYTHQQYYGPQIGQNYSQGWSLIWFLRRTRNPEWKGILETYFQTLKGEVTKWMDEQVAAEKEKGTWKEGWKPPFTPNEVEEAARDKALNAAYGGFDDRKWEKFEKEWKDFKY